MPEEHDLGEGGAPCPGGLEDGADLRSRVGAFLQRPHEPGDIAGEHGLAFVVAVRDPEPPLHELDRAVIGQDHSAAPPPGRPQQRITS